MKRSPIIRGGPFLEFGTHGVTRESKIITFDNYEARRFRAPSDIYVYTDGDIEVTGEDGLSHYYRPAQVELFLLLHIMKHVHRDLADVLDRRAQIIDESKDEITPPIGGYGS